MVPLIQTYQNQIYRFILKLRKAKYILVKLTHVVRQVNYHQVVFCHVNYIIIYFPKLTLLNVDFLCMINFIDLI